jgi:predicted ATPase/DNA-binding SARP family transcriptional activator/predicted negative regulator of RcsB-dependent stress response
MPKNTNMPIETVSTIHLRLLGPFGIVLNDRPMLPLRSRSGLHLLALLALHANREVAREWLAGTLWPDSREEQALANLRRTLTDLRRALGVAAERLTAPNTHTLSLRLTEEECDLLAFDTALKSKRAEAWRQAIALYRGPLLADSYETWIEPERAARQEGYLHALERLAQHARAQGDWQEAAHLLRLAIAADPLRESLYAALMEALAQGGDRAEAVQVYHTLRLRLHEAFADAEPAPEITALYRRLRSERQSLSPLPPAPHKPPPAPFPHNLPQRLTAFVGREQERIALHDCLRTARLITLTGTGGIGKTRLALEVAEEQGHTFPEGVWLVELAALTDSTLVPNAVADVLGLREEIGRPILQTVQAALRSRRLLLLLDNCEHHLNACASFADAALRECPQVRILATSRQALGVTGEIAWQVPSLPLPPREMTGKGENTGAAQLLEYASSQLFVARAQAVLPTFVLTPADVPSVAQICRRLDGIPLALELAAARLRSLSIAQIAARLDDRFRLLTHGDRAALPRQQTLRALIDWSYEPLSESERLLLHRLCLFSGGWTLEACEQVCGGDGLAPDDILDLLTLLVEKSLVIAEPHGLACRYRLLETLRQYAAEKLATEGATRRTAERHRDWCVALAEQGVIHLRGPEQSTWLQRLEAELENVRTALQLSGGGLERLRIAAALGGFCYIRGYLREGRKWLREALSENPGAPPRLRSKALKALGDLCWAMADYPEAWALHQENLTLQRKQEDIPGIAYTLHSLGLVHYHQGENAQACVLYEESLDLVRTLDDRRALGVILTNLAIAQKDRGEYAAAQQALREAETLLREEENLRGLAGNLHSQAVIAKRCSEYASAKSHLQEALTLFMELQDSHGIASARHTQGEVAFYEGDYAAARACYDAALPIFEELGAMRYVAGTLFNLGELTCVQGDFAAARDYHRRSLQLEREAHNQGGILGSLVGIATLAQASGQSAQSARLYGAAMHQGERLGTPLPPNVQADHDTRLRALRAALGESEFERLWSEGAALSLEQAIDFAAVL